MKLCHQVRVLITLVMETFKRHILNISYVNRSVNVVGAREKLEHSVGLEVVVRVVTVLIESEAWLTRTGVGGLSGPDIVLSGPTQGENWEQH